MKNKQIIQTILTIASCAGVVATAVFSAKDTEKKIELEKDHKLTKTETAKCYVRTIVAASATIASSIATRKVQKGEIAAMAGTLAFVAKQKADLQKQIQEKDPNLYCEIMNEQADKHISEAPKEHEPNQHLFYEPTTEQLFWSTTEEVYDAVICLNERLSSDGFVEFGWWLKLLSDELKVKKKDRDRGWDFCIGVDYVGYCFMRPDIVPVLDENGNEKYRRIDYNWMPGPLDEEEYDKYMKKLFEENNQEFERKMADPRE